MCTALTQPKVNKSDIFFNVDILTTLYKQVRFFYGYYGIIVLSCFSENKHFFSDLSKSLTKIEDRLKRVEKDRDQLSTATDKLRDNLASTETRKKELQHQVRSMILKNAINVNN